MEITAVFFILFTHSTTSYDMLLAGQKPNKHWPHGEKMQYPEKWTQELFDELEAEGTYWSNHKPHGEKMYNGHKNWNHWNVSLWLFNNELNYEYVKMVTEKETLDESARILAHIMKGYLYSFKNGRFVTFHPGLDLEGNEIEARTTPDGAQWSKTAIRAALVGVR